MTLAGRLRRYEEIARGIVRGHRGARIGRRVRLTGPGSYRLESGCAIRDGVRMWVGPGATLLVGPRTSIGDRCIINVATSVIIGPATQISWEVQILDTDFHRITSEGGEVRPHRAPISIGTHVLIGTRAMVLKGVSVDDGAVVAAGAIVTRDVEARSIVAGNPAASVGRAADWA